MYTFITGCLRNFLYRFHTPLHRSVTSSRSDRLFSFIRTRPWFDSDITQRTFPFTASNALCLLIHVLTPSIHAAAIIRIQTRIQFTVVFHCVICFLRSNLPRGVLPSQPISHRVQAAFAFTFPIVFNAVVFRYVIRHECVLWSPYSPRYLCTHLAHLVTTIASASPEFFQLLLVAMLLPGPMF